MAIGWIRAWAEEDKLRAAGSFKNDKAVSKFRSRFKTSLFQSKSTSSAKLKSLKWGDEVELPDGIKSSEFTKVVSGSKAGFVPSQHLVEIAYVNKTSGKNAFVATLVRDGLGNDKVKLIWGDLVQIVKRGSQSCNVRVRGMTGVVAKDRLTSEALLETYFIDVGQGDGVFVRFPSGRTMLIDGGLPRANQMTGKNAADFVDWKFYSDYGHHTITLDSMVASHCDADHYGGLWDLVRMDPSDDDELDCIHVVVKEFCHAGLSRWVKKGGAPPHKDGLGPNDDGWFVRLLGGREDAEKSVIKGAADELQGDWKSFIAAILDRSKSTKFTRLAVDQTVLKEGGKLPEYKVGNDKTTVVRVLAPVTKAHGGKAALKDLGDKGQNTNGHSITLQIHYGNARLLMTGDLNRNSMDWMVENFGDRIAALNCDVAKACHHGSHDVSYQFLEHVKAAATVISSGDAEGHAHPRPEIVAASAVSGHVQIDRKKDTLLTPLIYMTEIERSVSLGQVTHIRFTNHPVAGGGTTDGALFAVPKDEVPDLAYLTFGDRKAIEKTPSNKKKIEKEAVKREKAKLAMSAAANPGSFHYRTIHELFSIQYGTSPVKSSRIMNKNHYGLVNVRTDGKTIMCATMKESGEGWTVHSFPARFTPVD